MKQFARLAAYSGLLIGSVMSLNIQSEDTVVSSDLNLEVQIIRIKAEAIVSLRYEIRSELEAPKEMYLGERVVTISAPTLIAATQKPMVVQPKAE